MANQEQTDEILIEQSQQGQLDAFNQLVLRYQNLVYSVSYRIMGDSHSASDVTQDTFLKAYQKLNTFRGGNFKAWLTRIASNRCYDELRKIKRHPETYLEDLTPDDSNDEAPIPSSTDTPEEVAQQADLQRAIQQCIQNLKADQRIVLVLSDVQEMSYQEIAKTTNIQIGTVKSRLSRARLSVRNCLQGFSELLPDQYRL
jgi:RNA polymerase sigma-70 factor, ECF subfamily